MKKLTLIFLVFCALVNYHYSQKFELDTLKYTGSSDKYINFVIMGDGYTKDEQDSFYVDAKELSDYLFKQSPWSNYANYFNVFCIRVISAESGTKHPNTASDCSSAHTAVPYSNPDTYFDCTFDAYGIHRLVTIENYDAVRSVLRTNFPDYDQAFIIANSPYYGGSGGECAVSTTDESSKKIADHEIGHSFAGLGDEYYAGDVYAEEKPNMTMETDPNLVKWENWMNVDKVGIYQHCCGGNSAQWYKPGEHCKMQTLGKEYCHVCKQTIIEKIHSLVNPIVRYSPANTNVSSYEPVIYFSLTELMKPTPNTLSIEWKLDGVAIFKNQESIQLDQTSLSSGTHTLEVTVSDVTDLIRIDDHSNIHSNSVTWMIHKK